MILDQNQTIAAITGGVQQKIHRDELRGPGFRHNLGTKDGQDERSFFRAYAGAVRHGGRGKHQQAGYRGSGKHAKCQ